MPDNTGYCLERDVHDALARCRLEGEWFGISPENAIEAIKQVATNRGYPMSLAMSLSNAQSWCSLWQACRTHRNRMRFHSTTDAAELNGRAPACSYRGGGFRLSGGVNYPQ
jgi:Meiotically Up-regulated Gene 113 (MUG113) protein